jgi:uncharacterized membrane protein YraQ (UPF0718 family)/copper chaperone CopZ
MVFLEYIYSFLESSWDTLREMAPYLLFGFFVAGLLSIFVKPSIVERHLGGRGILQVVKASLFGVPLPLCSCGVIPVSASIRKHGAGEGATTSFLISTPQTGVDSIMVTLSLLGPVFAIFRPAVSFLSGLVGGTLVTYFGGAASGQKEKAQCHTECFTGSGKSLGFGHALRYGFVTLVDDLYKALIIGILIAGVISAFIPDDYFYPILGGGLVSMLVIMAAGIPVYVCATASVPIAAALIAKGISPGAALVFLMTGPATNAATISTVWKIMGKRTALIYLATVVASALGAGLLLDYIFATGDFSVSSTMPRMIPGWVKTGGGISMLIILAAAVYRSWRQEAKKPKEVAGGMKIRIDGMSCHHCADTIRRALMDVEGVTGAEVDFKKGIAYLTGDDPDVSMIKEAIEEVGYDFVGVEDQQE